MAKTANPEKEHQKIENFRKLAHNRLKRAKKQVTLLDNLTAYAYIMDENYAYEVLEELEKAVAVLRANWEERLKNLGKRSRKKKDDVPGTVTIDPSTTPDPEKKFRAVVDKPLDVNVNEDDEEDEDEEDDETTSVDLSLDPSEDPDAVLAGLLNPEDDS